MQFRHGAIIADGCRSASSQMRKHADGHHHGHCSDGKYHAVWYVPVDGQSYGGFCHCCCAGRTHTDALCSGNNSPVGPTGTGEDYGTTRIDQ